MWLPAFGDNCAVDARNGRRVWRHKKLSSCDLSATPLSQSLLDLLTKTLPQSETLSVHSR